ncbi:hypothetical protein [Streptomyces sp. NPDC089915]|uniref:hypothetical protein n=1 Tax=Streptomyces sp. NPDC089915 TaxID=3155186 RepID=UPI0034141833
MDVAENSPADAERGDRPRAREPKSLGVPAPSQALLDRARSGWQRFIDSIEDLSDE